MPDPPFDITGRVAIITGGGTGIGRATALVLATFGADVVLASRRMPNLESVAEEVRALGRRALPVQTDVHESGDIQEMVRRTVQEFGKIDILVNNAGGSYRAPAEEVTEQHWDRMVSLNLRGPFLCSQAAGKVMREQGGGVIFNISSGLARMLGPNGQGGRRGGPGVVYGTSKAAPDRFAAGVAAELREKNIAIINIYPGFTLTERLERLMKDADTSRMERPETTAKAVAFLSRDPMPHTGRIVVARELAGEHDL